MSEDYGAKISLPGYDASTDTDVQHFMLNSKYQTMKTYIVNTGSFSISNESYSQTNHNILTLTHGLGYKPMCTMYWKKSSGLIGSDFWIEFHTGNYTYIAWTVDTNSFYIDYKYIGSGTTGLSGANWTFKYYIFINAGLP